MVKNRKNMNNFKRKIIQKNNYGKNIYFLNNTILNNVFK